jgi:di/tripeptidase
VQRTRGGLPLWVDPTTKIKSTTYITGMNPVMGLTGGFMDAQMCYLVDAQSQTHVQYNNYYVYDMVFTFSGTKIPGIYDDEAGINAVKNAIEFASALVTDDVTLTVDNGSGYVFIKSLDGDFLSAKLVLEIKDLEKANMDDRVNRIKAVLGRMKSGTISTVSYTITKKFENVRTRIPKSMVGLAVQSIYDKYVLGTMTTPIHHGYTAAQLTLKGVPTVSLSCGAFNYYTPQECVPVPSLTNCFEVLVNIVKNSFSYNFGTDFL